MRDTPVGTRRVYRLDAEGLDLLRTYLDRLWAGALDRFASAAEAAHVESTGRTDHPEPSTRPNHPSGDARDR